MQYAILLQLQTNGMYQATVPLIPKLKKVAKTKAQALQAIQQAIMVFEKRNEIVYLHVPDPSPEAWTEDDPILQLGVNPITDEITDATINHEHYIYP